MSDIINIPSHCIVTVRRPNGDIEIINYTDATNGQIRTMRDKDMAMINKAMAKANRGEIISYKNVTKTAEAQKPSASDIADMEYIRRTNAIYRASAAGEPCDKIGGADDIDRTPAHPSDY